MLEGNNVKKETTCTHHTRYLEHTTSYDTYISETFKSLLTFLGIPHNVENVWFCARYLFLDASLEMVRNIFFVKT